MKMIVISNGLKWSKSEVIVDFTPNIKQSTKNMYPLGNLGDKSVDN